MKVSKSSTIINNDSLELYDHYIGLDWSSTTESAIARMRPSSIEPKIISINSELKEIKQYIKALKGKKILTFEETTGAHWLYVELKDCVNKIIICNPWRNHLLKEGPKTDKIDAGKLCMLLRSGMLKEVYHQYDEENYNIRKLVSAYDDLIIADVRLQNQYSALHRSEGLKSKEVYKKNDKILKFIFELQIDLMKKFKENREIYEAYFKELVRKNRIIGYIYEVSGFGPILSVKAYGQIIDATRFDNKYHFWCYSGLVKNKRASGSTSYNKKEIRFSRKLKYIFNKATQAALEGKNDIREYYEYLLKKGFMPKKAWNIVCRYIATSIYAIIKNGTRYKSYSWRKKLALQHS